MFLGFFVGKKGKAVLGAGIRPSFCRVLIAARKASVLMIYIDCMDGSYWWGAKEGKRVSRFLLKQMKTCKIKQN